LGTGSALKFFCMRAEDGDGDGVVEDEGAGVVELVGRPAESDAEGGGGGAGFLHLRNKFIGRRSSGVC